MKIIAVDFDGCLCQYAWPDIGTPNLNVIETLISMRALGHAKLILWTCREGETLEKAVEFCKNLGLEFDAINDNLPEQKVKYHNNSRKVSADEYWDDRAVKVIFNGGAKLVEV